MSVWAFDSSFEHSVIFVIMTMQYWIDYKNEVLNPIDISFIFC